MLEKWNEIERILQRPYLVDPDFIYQKLKKDESYPVFTLPSNLAEIPKKPEIGSFTNHLQAPKGIKKMVPGAQKAFEAKLEDANRQFSIAFTKYAKLMEERERKIAILLKKYEDEKIKKNSELTIDQSLKNDSLNMNCQRLRLSHLLWNIDISKLEMRLLIS